MDYIRYSSAGRRWEVFGRCVWADPNAWGPCGVGSPDPPPGPPEGRLDVPMAPGATCALCIDGGHLRIVNL